MLTNVRAVIFDLDDTLLDRRGSFARFVRDQRARFAHALATVETEQYVRAVVELDGDGDLPRHALFTGVCARFDLPSGLAGTLLADYRDRFAAACRLFPDALPTLAALRAAGLRLGLITNGGLRMQRRKVECLALAGRFDAILISAAEGIAKPDPRIFQRALARLDAEAATSVFVGNHPDVDIAGARGAGLRAVWRRDPAVSRAVDADAVIDTIGALRVVLGVQAAGTRT